LERHQQTDEEPDIDGGPAPRQAAGRPGGRPRGEDRGRHQPAHVVLDDSRERLALEALCAPRQEDVGDAHERRGRHERECAGADAAQGHERDGRRRPRDQGQARGAERAPERRRQLVQDEAVLAGALGDGDAELLREDVARRVEPDRPEVDGVERVAGQGGVADEPEAARCGDRAAE
jgi:hypothetical protein